MKKTRQKQVYTLFHQAGGVLRMAEALHLGIHRRELYHLRDSGQLEVLSRGLYRLKSTKEAQFPDFIPAAKKVPRGVICLISALAFHGITTQIPHFVYLAIPRNAYKPTISHPPMRYFWYSEKMLKTGVLRHHVVGCSFKIFNLEKTLIDCVKYRNKIGMDVVLEALKMYWRRGKPNLNKLMDYARLFRVERVLKPIIETIISE
jgi:predicted transcriptional regulator of viral defense system